MWLARHTGWRRAKLCGLDASKLSNTHSFAVRRPRLEMALDRSIHRKMRILLTMRKERARCRDGSRTAEPEEGPPDNESNREAEELSKLVGLDGAEAGAETPSSGCDSEEGKEEQPSLRETQTPKGRGLRQPANDGRESPNEGNASETPKSAEQSQNVIENKGPAAEEVNG